MAQGLHVGNHRLWPGSSSDEDTCFLAVHASIIILVQSVPEEQGVAYGHVESNGYLFLY